MASGASAADVRSILSIAGAGPSTSSTTNTNGVSTTTQVQPTASSSKLPQVLSATTSLQNIIPLTGGATPSRKTKPEGISRELYALIGTGIPSLSAKPKFKQKPKLSDGRVGRWEWRSFENKARPDGLKLSHWVKASTDPNVEYPFAKYNVPAQTYMYTDEEYEKLLKDPNWTKEETDYLFSLVREYDLRFYIVADRYDYEGSRARNQASNTNVPIPSTSTTNPVNGSTPAIDGEIVIKEEVQSPEKMDVDNAPNGVNGVLNTRVDAGVLEVKSRSIEDLKDRYFTVCRRLIRSRPTEDESARAQLLASYHYDKEIEITRKKYLASLESRTPEQIAEEEALYIEIKRLEQDEHRFARAREDLLRVFAGVESGLPYVAIEDEGSVVVLGDSKVKKKKGGVGAAGAAEVESPISAQATTGMAIPQTPIRKTPGLQQTPEDDVRQCVHRFDTATTTKAAHTAVHARTWKIPQPKSALAPRIIQIMAEVGVSTQKLVMPTKENVLLLESVMQAASALAETKKQIDRVEHEIRVAKKVLGIEEGEGEGTKGKGRGKGKGKGKRIAVPGASGNENEDAAPGPSDGGGVVDEAGGGEEGEEEENDAEGELDADADGDNDAEGEEVDAEGERATSVATSVRSVGRKKKRSVSISSVDTTATSVARLPRKRQKN